MALFLNSERKIKNIWWVVIFFVLLSALLFPLIILADYFSFEITLTHQIVLISVASIICQVLRKKPISDLTGRINFIWLKELFTGFLIGGALMVLPVFFLTFFGYIQWQLNIFSLPTILSGFSVFFLVALAEELLFRGYIFQRFIKAFGNWPAQFLVAALFLLTHMNNPGMTGTVKILASINIFIASIMFGIAYIKTKSLAMPLGLHFMANYMQGTILGFGVSGNKEPSLFKSVFDNAPVWFSGGDFGIEASALGLCFVILVTVLLYIWQPSYLGRQITTNIN